MIVAKFEDLMALLEVIQQFHIVLECSIERLLSGFCSVRDTIQVNLVFLGKNPNLSGMGCMCFDVVYHLSL